MSLVRLGSDRRGAIAIIFALTSVILVPFLAIAVDVGNIFTAHRALQGATDLAAIAAATDLANASSAATANAALNGYLSAEVTNVTVGIYTPNPAIPAGSRFVASALSASNAAQVTMSHQQPLFFGGLLRSSNTSNPPGSSSLIVTQAIATQTHSISFAIGSQVASLDGGILNSMLGALIGTQVSVSVGDYQALASAQVDLFALAKAVSLTLGQVGGSYSQAFSNTVPMSVLLSALQQTATGPTQALVTLVSAAEGGSTTVDLSRLLEFGSYSNRLVADVEPNATTKASVLSLLQAALQVGGAPHLISLNLSATLPGLSSITGMMTIGEPAQGTTVMAVDILGTSVHTAQARLFLNVSLLTAVQGGVVSMPLYLEIGSGTATLAALACTPLDGTQTQATLDVTPGLVSGWLGNVTAASMVNYTTSPIVTSATMLNLAGLLSVTGLASAQVANLTAVPVTFSATDIAQATIKSTTTNDVLGALINSLVGNVSLKVTVLGLGVLVPPGVTSSVASALSQGVQPVDQLITSVLQSLGVGVGVADTWVTNARCAAATLGG